MIRTEIEIKRLQRLREGQIINILYAGKTEKAKIINNFKNARILDIKISEKWYFFFDPIYLSRFYEWDGFTITLKEDLI